VWEERRYRRAQLALQKGDEELAKEALVRRKSFQENADSLMSQFAAQKEATEKLMSNTKLLETKLAEAKAKKVRTALLCRLAALRSSFERGREHQHPQAARYHTSDSQTCLLLLLGIACGYNVRMRRLTLTVWYDWALLQDTLKARAQSAKTAKAVQEMASGMSTSNALAAFERMEEKVHAWRSSPFPAHSLTTLSALSILARQLRSADCLALGEDVRGMGGRAGNEDGGGGGRDDDAGGRRRTGAGVRHAGGGQCGR
jgi:hypothetical protein